MHTGDGRHRFGNRLGRAAGLIVAALSSGAAMAQQTITVDFPHRDVDIDSFPFTTATLADLPGPDGRVSFAEALIVSNNTPGVQTIAFAVEPTDFFFQTESPGVVVVFMDPPSFNDVTAPVIIDGTTQTAFGGDTNVEGAEVRIRGANLNIFAPDVVVRGLDSSVVSLGIGAVNCTIENNTGLFPLARGDGAGAIEVIGNGESAGHIIRDNEVGFISVERSDGNVVVGNTTRRIEVRGFVSEFGGTGPSTGNQIGGPNPADGNIVMGDGSFSSSPFGMPSGWCVRLFDTEDTLIENNLIGTTPDGMASGSDTATIGVWTAGGVNHNLTIRGNTIAGIKSEGLLGFDNFFFGSPMILEGQNITLTGNAIGLDANAQPTLGSPSATVLLGTEIRVGGTVPGEGNEVTGHTFGAIDLIAADVSELAVEISGNSFHDNNLAGDPTFVDIDLRVSSFGPTPNDALDADTGPNGFQNFPDLSEATSTPGVGTRVVGTLASEPGASYRVEVFASPACGPAGFGPGELFLGAFEVMTNASGGVSFDQTLPVEVNAGWVATATATNLATRVTSEFSACIDIAGSAGCPADLNQDGSVGASDLAISLGSWGQPGPADLDGDGIVNASDLAILLGGWGPCS